MNSQGSDAPDPRPAGRPRDLASRRSILSATMSLLQTMSVTDLAIETVAREARVSKATIYRWWDGKAALVIDAFMESHFSNTPMPTAVDPRTALKRHLTSLVQYFSGRAGKLVVQILSEGHNNDALLADFNERFSKNRRRLVQETFQRGQREGLFRLDVDAAWAVEMLYSPIYRRLIFGQPLDDEFVGLLCKSVDSLFSTDTKPKAPQPGPKK
ncbi:TetR family transcriptional regulator [Bradyrhizobium canariense]|uniref:TetR family transcriptional regulator n=1 Tax=Bradyrhizobium canariense TaxID=255045 RepID=A0A1X3F3C1_9BRAD|nr:MULTISPECIES: TetR/AcrR family transcriptional regulator [Bradyrhizobium]EIG57928.1 transcriptional regulator [Bradyrhizobium sp. WSM1253]OSI61111.1 TetR family transcriptional regulator [Bradyrhizobium canariense]OSI64672.1 TetR family transcriptional regulator [Bradyrhizobium canariense]OSI79200.1 TetR family transcriptional regulator [Bradyrhizobium canariense]OSI90696.1 TetR family transcriptional regulator [Bradyrhizobium canariense]